MRTSRRPWSAPRGAPPRRCSGRLPPRHAEAVAALRDALAELTAARTGVAAFADAEAKRTAAQAAEQRAATLQHVDRGARRAAARLSSDAARLFEARQWADAAARYADAAAAWQALETKERADALGDEVSGVLERLAQLGAHASALELTVDAPGLAELRRDLGTATELARGGAREQAVEQLEGVRDAAAAAETAYAAALAAALGRGAGAAGTRWTELAGRAGGLATPQRAAEAERQLNAVGAAVDTAAWDAARRGLEAVSAWLTRTESDLRGEAEHAAAGHIAALESAADALRRDAAELPPAADVRAARTGVAAALDAGRFAAAIQMAGAARAAAEDAVAAHRRVLAERAAAARAAVDALVARLEVDAARLAAPQAIDDATQARGAGEAAEGRGEFRDAIAAYERAATAFERGAEALEEARRRQIADAAGEVRALLHGAAAAPAALIAPARLAAEQALSAGEGAASAAALAALQEAHAGLTRALADAARYREAEANKQAVEETVVRIKALPLTAQERDEATVVLQDATQAFARHAWDDARQRYAEAQARLETLADAVEQRVEEEKQRAAQLAAAREALRGAADAARGDPTDVVGAALGAAKRLVTDGADLGALAAAQAALVAARGEVPDYQTAVERRAAARTAAERAAQKQPARRFLKRPARTLQRADAALAKRQWQAAAAGYDSAAREYAAAELIKPSTLPRWAIPAALPVLGALAYLTYQSTGLVREQERPQPPPQTEASQVTEEKVAEKKVAPQPEATKFAPSEVGPAPAVKLPSIADAQPPDASVNLDEGGAQPFSIQLADASGTNPDIEWLFNGTPVSDARGKTSWLYRPDYGAAGTYDVAVTVGDGDAPARRRAWTVDVTDVNRGIELAQVVPPTSQDIRKTIGQSVDFAVKATDKDGDVLRYAWTVDGQPAGGNQPALELPVTKRTQTVALAITDGKLPKPDSLQWRVTGVPAEFKPAVSPNSLTSLDFQKSQLFKLEPPAGQSASDLEVAWAVNGEKVSDGLAFTFKADDPALVSGDPVQISVTARDDQGGEFKKAWSPKVVPPAPRIAGASPSGTTPIALKPGQQQTFRIDAPAPVGNQSFSYSFSVNGKPVASAPSYELTAEEGTDYTVVASLRDNYGQRAAERKWTIKVPRDTTTSASTGPSGGVATLVEAWLDTYRGALNTKNTPQICATLGLSSEKCATLGKALTGQEDLRVSFSGVQITPSGADAACATYTRQDSFIDPSGKNQSRSTAVNQCFKVVNGQAQLVRN